MLPKATEAVWNFVKEQPALSGFVLVGGSALALRIGHRVSEDLDLAFPELTLPRGRITALLHLAEGNFRFERNDNEVALQEFLQGGLELHDYQQDFVVDNIVKVTFFAPDASQRKILREAPEEHIRLATLSELFKSKALLSARRSKTRDWLDLYLLMRNYNFSIRDYQDAFREGEVISECDLGLSRLCGGIPQRDDEGYQHLLDSAPTLEEMKNFFVQQRDLLEVETARAAKTKGTPSGAPSKQS